MSESLILTISDTARGGAGVAREESGRVIFVPFTAPGDRVRVRITEARKNYAQGELLELLEPSSCRVAPRCPVFSKCGGCEWQHLPYEVQWRTKSQGVLHALRRVGLEEAIRGVAFEELRARDPWEYRNRIQLRGTGGSMGFYAAGSHEVVPVERCEIARAEINAAFESVREEGRRLARPFKVEIEVLPDGSVRRLWNAGHSAGGFRQVNDAQNERLREWVASALTPDRELIDLYGGSGNLSLGLAARMRKIDCVDSSAPRERPAGTPANLLFHRASVLSWLLRAGRAGSAILDPPREGLGAFAQEIVVAIRALGVNELVAVGCDPDAWARDLLRFHRQGWRIQRVAALDMFPQTHHIESLALLRL